MRETPVWTKFKPIKPITKSFNTIDQRRRVWNLNENEEKQLKTNDLNVENLQRRTRLSDGNVQNWKCIKNKSKFFVRQKRIKKNEEKIGQNDRTNRTIGNKTEWKKKNRRAQSSR